MAKSAFPKQKSAQNEYSSDFEGLTLSRPRQGRYYKTAVKCKVAVALCTRVRTTVVFSKLNFKTRLLVRTREQSIAFKRQNFDFESAFAVLFESTAKPQREAQKRLSESNNCNITGIFQ